MALVDEVTSRYSSQILVNASNPQNSTATTTDTTRLNLAVTDVQAAFKMRGMIYDNTNAKHVLVAVPGVYARLLIMTAQGGKDDWKDFLAELDILKETESRDRIMPTTDSLKSETEDKIGELVQTDRRNFKDYVPRAPTGPNTSTPPDSNL